MKTNPCFRSTLLCLQTGARNPKLEDIQTEVYKSQAVTDTIWTLTQTKLIAAL
jgi:hypothetical protein